MASPRTLLGECLPTGKDANNLQKLLMQSYLEFFNWYLANTFAHYDKVKPTNNTRPRSEAAANTEEITHMAFFELRQYNIRRNKMKEWLKIFSEEIAPFQIAKGMVICVSWHGETDDSVFVWMRRFNSEKERERLYKAVYEDPHWQNEISSRVGKLIDRKKIQVQRIVPTKKSNVQ